MKTQTKFFNVFAWMGKRKVKIGTAYHQEKTDSIRLKADPHIDSAKVGRALLKGDVLIEQQAPRPAPLAPPENIEAETYVCHADEQDEIREAEDLKALRAAQNAEASR